MTTGAVNAALRIITQTLMAKFNEQLLIGGLCRHDYSATEPRQAGDTIQVTADIGELLPDMISTMDPLEYATILARSAPVAFRLKQEVVEFNIHDVSALLLERSIIENDLQIVVEQLTGFIELGLIDSISQFEKQVGSPSEGITPNLIDVIDRMLFEQADLQGQTHILVDEDGWQQISTRCGGKAASFDISTPAPDYYSQMLFNAAFHTDALCLVTRIPQLNQTVSHLDIESDNIGLTVVVVPGAEHNSLTVRVIMLYAVGLFRKDLGIRIATIDTFSRSIADSQNGIKDTLQQKYHQQHPVISLDGLRAALPVTVADSNLVRLRTIIESLSDIIDDPHTRLQSAVKIMARTDNLGPVNLIEACSRQIQRMDAALADFKNAYDAKYRLEINSREDRIVNTETRIEATKNLLEEYYAQRATLQSEIAQERLVLISAESDFTNDLQALRLEADALSASLTEIVTSKPAQRKPLSKHLNAAPAANGTLNN